MHVWKSQSYKCDADTFNASPLLVATKIKELMNGVCVFLLFVYITELTFPMPAWAWPILTTTGKDGVVTCRQKHQSISWSDYFGLSIAGWGGWSLYVFLATKKVVDQFLNEHFTFVMGQKQGLSCTFNIL